MRPTVLLVDDEEDIRYFITLLLTEWGFEVVEAGDGVSAFRRFLERMPPIVLTDIKMPGMDGIELLKRVKKENRDTEVIMISGHGDMTLAIDSLTYEASDFITKPIDENLLRHALQKAEERISLKTELKNYTANLENLVKEKSAHIVELERQIAASQVLEQLSSAMKTIASETGLAPYSPEIPCFVSLLNGKGEIVSTNRHYTDRFGDRRHAPGRGIYKALGTDGAVPAVGERSFPGEKRNLSFRTAVDAAGAEIPVMVHEVPITGADGRVELVIQIAVDLTGVRTLQERLKRTQWKYQRLFDESPCYVTVQDKNLCIREANARFRRDFDFEEGQTCFSSYKQRSEPCAECPVVRTFEDGRHHQAESVVTTKKGEQLYILVWTAPLAGEGDETTHVLEMATDITQLRQLQDHVTSLGVMLGSMSHGIKGLLMAIDGGIYRVDTGFARRDLDEAQKGWEMIRLRVERIQSMIKDILYYSKPRELEAEILSLRSFCDDLARLVVPKAQKAGTEFVVDLQRADGVLEADPVALSSALLNFLENALDACEMDRSKKEHRVAFSVRREGSVLVFEIMDNGIGMEPETKNNMFSLYFSSKGSRGTGIGLFVANQVIRQHQGRITVDSEFGKGTKVRVALPSGRLDAGNHGVRALEEQA
ncbi:MAG: response regulator [Thermodesulfobacteriota bacterium]